MTARVALLATVATMALAATGTIGIGRGTPSAAAQTTTTTTFPKCDNGPIDVMSHRPDPAWLTLPEGQVPPATTMAEIQGSRTLGGRPVDRQLVVGIDENAIGLAAKDPLTGEVSGFEVELARKFAQAILGDPNAVRFVIVTSPEEKLAVVENGTVDMTISVVTMDCKRWQRVDLSAPYYTAFQQALVRSDSPIGAQADLNGRRACVTRDSSSESFLEAEMPDVDVVAARTRTKCLVKLQENTVDAIVLPSSILAGLKAQDPTTRTIAGALREADGTPTANVYGIAMSNRNPDHDLTRYVNALLERWRADGSLVGLQKAYLEDRLGLPVSVPDVSYRD